MWKHPMSRMAPMAVPSRKATVFVVSLATLWHMAVSAFLVIYY